MTGQSGQISTPHPDAVSPPSPGRNSDPEPSPWTVQLVETDDDFLALESDWTRLFDDSPDLSVFLSWQWMHCWWKHYGPGWRLSVLAVTDGHGAARGIVPLVRRTITVGPVPVECIGFLANEGASASHMEVIARTEHRARLSALCIEFLETRAAPWDLFEVRHLGGASAFAERIAGLSGWHWTIPESTCPYVPLPDDWESFRSGLKSKVRRNLSYFHDLLGREAVETISARLVSDPVEVDQVLDRLIGMHLFRFRHSTLGKPPFMQFHHEFAREALGAGWLRLYILEVGGSIISVIYCLRRGDTVSAYLNGFDMHWARYSPGRQVASYAIRSAIEEGAEEFDWLQGDCRYKYEWTSRERCDLHVFVARTWRGRLRLSMNRVRIRSTRLRQAARRRLLSTLSPEARQRLRLAASRLRARRS